MKFLDWGRIDYIKAWSMQEELLQERIDGAIKQNILVFAEHESVYTLGKRGRKENILIGEDALKKRGLPVYEVNRGGDITYHGPGQLMVYFILHLSSFAYDVHAMLRWIEGLVINTLEGFGLKGHRIPQKTGVFCSGKKIASIGLGFRKWVSFHGLAFNIDPDMRFFSCIRPCGLDIEMTSMAKELGRKVGIEEVKENFSEIILSYNLQLTSYDL